MKSKLLPVLLILLVLLNGFLIFMLIKKPHEKEPEHQKRNFLTTQLNFTESQRKNFRALDKTHREYMMEIEDEIREHKDVLFNSFSNENFNSDSLTTKIGVLQANKDSEVFRFFSEVRKLCAPNQVKIFDTIINKALKGGERKPPRDGRMPPPR